MFYNTLRIDSKLSLLDIFNRSLISKLNQLCCMLLVYFH